MISLGSVWLPSASVAGAYGSALGNQISKQTFFGKVKAPSYNSEKLVIMFLSLFLRDYRLVRQFLDTALVVALSAGLYVFGWSVLSSMSAYPAMLFGLSFIFIAPALGYLMLRVGTSNEGRQALVRMLQEL